MEGVKKNTKIIVLVICVVIGLAAGFFGGFEFRNYQLSKSRSAFTTGTNGTFQRYMGGTRSGSQTGSAARMAGGGIVTGSILSVDTNSITVKLSDGSTRIILLSSSTTFSNTVSAASSDLKTGININVIGTANSDGSVTATSIQLNPVSFRPQGSPAPAPQQ